MNPPEKYSFIIRIPAVLGDYAILASKMSPCLKYIAVERLYNVRGVGDKLEGNNVSLEVVLEKLDG